MLQVTGYKGTHHSTAENASNMEMFVWLNFHPKTLSANKLLWVERQFVHCGLANMSETDNSDGKTAEGDNLTKE